MSTEPLFDPRNHLWFQDNGDGSVRVGVARAMLAIVGAPAFVRLPSAGAAFSQGEEVGSLETDKTSFAIALPFSGTVSAVHPPADAASLPSAEDGTQPLFSVSPADAEWGRGLVSASDYLSFIAP